MTKTIILMKIPKEDYEQERLANWLDANWYMFSAIRNESDTHSFYKGKIRVRSWCRKWIPDFCIILKKQSLLFIELKRQKRVLKSGKLWASPSIVSPEQIKWQEKLNKVNNVQCEIAYGYQEAISIIQMLENNDSC